MHPEMMSQLSMFLPMIFMRGSGDRAASGWEQWWIFICMLLGIFMTELRNCCRNTSLLEVFREIMHRRAQASTYKICMHATYRNNVMYDYTVSLPFKAVMHKLYSQVIKDPNARYYIKEEKLWGSVVKLVMFDNKFSMYKMDDNIQIMHTCMDDMSEKKDYTYYTYTMCITSRRNDMRSIVQFIDDAVDEYDMSQGELSFSQLSLYTLGDFKEDSQDQPCFHRVPFDSTKTFDNMFFADKDRLIQTVDRFLSNKMEYTRLGMPYTLGMLFTGAPGTGKTSAIKALAHHTKRHIMRIPLKHIETVEQLQAIFLSERINDVKIPVHKRLYVFEEIDCGPWKDIVTSRTLPPTHNTGSSPDVQQHLQDITESLKNALTPSDDDSCKISKKKPTKSSLQITLGDFLDILDGMVEMPGRMIVLTSNHPEVLDPALLRPGRIDLRIDFKVLRKEDVRDLYKLWFTHDLPSSVYDKMPDLICSQADLGNLFLTRDQERIFHRLINI